jgi:hypothetical protein
MNHPLNFIPQNLRKPLFYFFLAMTLVIFAIFRVLDQPLRTAAAPNGIVSFELAGTPEKVFQIMVSWEPINYQGPAIGRVKGYLFAAFGLGFDFLFMPVYALALSLGLLLAIGEKKNRYAAFAAWMGWGAFAATLFDATENYALWHVLTGAIFSPYPAIAAWCATFKFTLLIVGLVTALSGRLFSK